MYLDNFKENPCKWRAKELIAIGITAKPFNSKLIELTNLSNINKKYIEADERYGFKILKENGEKRYFLQVEFPDRPFGYTCTGLTFQFIDDKELVFEAEVEEEYFKVEEVAKRALKIDKEQVKNKVLEVMDKCGVESSLQISHMYQDDDYTFAYELYKEFGIIGRKPQIVQKNKNAEQDLVIYSGARDAKEKVKRLANGEYPFTNQSTFGFGYYFSDELTTPMIYSNKSKQNIIKAYLSSDSEVLDRDDLNRVKSLFLDKSYERAQELDGEEYLTLLTHILGYDVLRTKSNYGYGDENYYLPVNLEKIILEQQPFLEVESSEDNEK